MNWEHHQINVVAPGPLTALQFVSLTLNGGPVLDDVSVSLGSSLTSVQFQALDNPTDANPNAGGGLRYYPDANFPGDLAVHNRLRVVATVNPAAPNITVYFRSFDVDDPSSDDPALDPNGPAGNDNRGIAGPNAGLNATSATTDSSGSASVVLNVTMNPGDNFKVVASTDSSALALMTVQGINIVDGSGTVVPTSNAPAVVTDLLTVWRHLHTEVDSMGPVSGNMVSARVLQVIPQGSFTKVFLDRVPDPENNRFENGLLTVPGVGAYKIVASANSVLTVSGGVPLAAAQKLSTLVDDDDYNSNDASALRGDDGEPVAAQPDTFSLLQAGLAAAYITPVYDGGGSLANQQQNLPFILNFDETSSAAVSAALSRRDASGSDAFWVAYFQLGYQPSVLHDGDPGANSFRAGATGATGVSDLTPSCTGVPSGGLGSLLFLETARDWDHTLSIPAPLRNEQKTAALHELGHQFGLKGDDTLPGCPFGVMSYGDFIPSRDGGIAFPALCPSVYVPQHLNIMRCRMKSPGR